MSGAEVTPPPVRGWQHAVALSGGFLTWMSHLIVQAVLVGTACTWGSPWLLHLVLLLHLVPTLAVTWLSRWIVRRGGEGEVAASHRFLGWVALVLNVTSLVLIVAEWVPVVVLDACLP